MIHKGFDFTYLGGMPLNQQRLEWMQAAYAELSDGLAAMFGDNVIVSGCVVSGNTVTDGWIVVNGELLPFLGTRTGVLDTFLIRETLTPLTFKDGTSKNVQFNKFAQFGTSSNAIQWNSLQRLPSFKNVGLHLKDTDNPHQVTKAQVGLGNIPNAISSDPASSDPNIIATTAMVHGAITSANGVKMSGKFEIDKTNGATTFAIPKLIPANYQIIAQIVSEGDFFGRGTGIRTVEKAMTYVFLVNNPDDRPDQTLITAIYDIAVLPINDTLYCYYSLISL
jgi:hypothetical protein